MLEPQEKLPKFSPNYFITSNAITILENSKKIIPRRTVIGYRLGRGSN